MKGYLFKLFISFSLLAIAGCGFHLRGAANIPPSLQTIYVQGVNMQQGLGLELKRGLTRNNVNVVDNYQEGSAVLTVLENKVERRVLSVGSDAKVSEYELFGTAKFTIVDSQGKSLAEQQEVHAVRDLQFDQDQVLGKVEEAQVLRYQINQQMVQSIMTRLSVLK